MHRLVALMTVVCVSVAVCTLDSRPRLEPGKMAELWQEPGDLARRNLLHGPGGAERAPDPSGRYTLRKVDTAGFSVTYDVKDTRGQEWSVKLGPEARTEVVVSRLVWAMGYHQPPVYYLPSWTLIGNGRVTTERPARFRLESATERKTGTWSWRNNPFLDTQPFAGLFVLMVLVNNWDLKSPQNAVYEVEHEGEAPAARYVIKDLGASLGKTSWWLPGTRDDVDAFEREPFITGVSGGRVKFHFQGAWREPQLVDSVTVDDVRWMCERLARLSSAQWRDAFRAGGYTAREADRFIRRLRAKIDEGSRLGSDALYRAIP